jgi:flagellar basal-body rod modification protein FlgD
MDKNSFLKMLVTKLENQDPLSVDDSDFTTEMAQYSQVESSQNTLTQVTSMAAQLSNLNTNTVASLSLTNTAQAVSLIGKTVKLSVTDSTTNVTSTITGTVSSVAFVNGTPEISVNGTSYSLSDVTEVSA